jgi:hypothetical protein
MSPGSILVILFVLIIVVALFFVQPTQSGGGPFTISNELILIVLQSKSEKKLVPNFICIGEKHVSVNIHVGMTRSGANFVRLLSHNPQVHHIVLYNEAKNGATYRSDSNMEVLASINTSTGPAIERRVTYYPKNSAVVTNVDVDIRQYNLPMTSIFTRSHAIAADWIDHAASFPGAKWNDPDVFCRLFDYMYNPTNRLSPLHDLDNTLLTSVEFRLIYARIRAYLYREIETMKLREEYKNFSPRLFMEMSGLELLTLCNLLTRPREVGTIPIFVAGAAHTRLLTRALEPYMESTTFTYRDICPGERYFVDAVLKDAPLPAEDPTKIISFNIYKLKNDSVVIEIIPRTFQDPAVGHYVETLRKALGASIYSSVPLAGFTSPFQSFGTWLVDESANITTVNEGPFEIYQPYFDTGTDAGLAMKVRIAFKSEVMEKLIPAAEAFLHKKHLLSSWHSIMEDDKKRGVRDRGMFVRSLEWLETEFQLDFIEKCGTQFCVIVNRMMSIPDMSREMYELEAKELMRLIDSRDGDFDLPSANQIQALVASEGVHVPHVKTTDGAFVENTIGNFTLDHMPPPWSVDFTYRPEFDGEITKDTVTPVTDEAVRAKIEQNYLLVFDNPPPIPDLQHPPQPARELAAVEL